MDLVSVIMPTYNTPYAYLLDAINSILNQTYKNIELIIVDDSSTEYSNYNYIYEQIGYDHRVKVVKNRYTKGVAGALNTGLEIAEGEFIFRMDSDDIAKRDRIETQVNYMMAHSEVSVLCSYAKCFQDSRNVHRIYSDNTAIKTSLLFHCAIVHPTICIRKPLLDDKTIVYENVQVEDYNLWMKIALVKGYKFSCCKKVLLKYRVHSKQVTITKKELMNAQGLALRKEFYERLGIIMNERDLISFGNFTMCVSEERGMTELFEVIKDMYNQCKSKDIFEHKKIYKKTFMELCMKKCIRLIQYGDLRYIKLMLKVMMI